MIDIVHAIYDCINSSGLEFVAVFEAGSRYFFVTRRAAGPHDIPASPVLSALSSDALGIYDIDEIAQVRGSETYLRWRASLRSLSRKHTLIAVAISRRLEREIPK